jgi:putative glutamine amidotransferase
VRPRIAIVCRPCESTAVYERAVELAGGEALVVGPGPAEDALAMLADAQGVILAGGPDLAPGLYGHERWNGTVEVDTERDEVDQLAWGCLAERVEVPLLGICRGVQAMNVFAGGTLVQDIPTQVRGQLCHATPKERPETTHVVSIEAGSGLAGIVGGEPWLTNSFHHQALECVASGLRAVAWAADGVVEAVEGVGGGYRIGVQFHPERAVETDARAMALFASLVKASGG